MFELAQRKLLRQVSQYAETSGDLYPRLVVVDFLDMVKQGGMSDSCLYTDLFASEGNRTGQSAIRVLLNMYEGPDG